MFTNSLADLYILSSINSDQIEKVNTGLLLRRAAEFSDVTIAHNAIRFGLRDAKQRHIESNINLRRGLFQAWSSALVAVEDRGAIISIFSGDKFVPGMPIGAAKRNADTC